MRNEKGQFVKGNIHTPESLEKMRLSHLGMKQSDETKRKKSIAFAGNKNPLWKNGVSGNGTGYIRILKPEHLYASKRGHVFQHRLVMEEFLGRFLTKEEEVHHINGIRDDNCIENLMLFENHFKHMQYHIKQRIINYFLSMLIIDKFKEVNQWAT